MEKIPQSKVRVRFQDCDPFNHLNNSKYLDYFINAREDHLLEHYRLDIFTHMKQYCKAWVVGSNQVMYVRPALVMEEVLIDSKLIEFGAKNLTVEMTMWDAERTQLKAILWVKFLYVDFKTNRATEHPEDLIAFFGNVVVPVEEKVFEERCQGIVKSQKSVTAEG
jgi:thioesterase III